jgi:ribulose-phosphate 3-epimerase
MSKLAPSILSADFGCLAEEVRCVEQAGADYVHVDVMDGHFVPNISFGAAVMKSLVGRTAMPFDVHLMIEEADRYLDDFVTGQTACITVHQEACVHLNRTLQRIRDCGVRAGAALNPATPAAALDCVLADVDLVLVMSVNPGFGGQTFLPASLDKIRQLADLRRTRGLSYAIEVDGGVTADNAPDILAAGADILVAGSAVFGAADRQAAVRALQAPGCGGAADAGAE